MADLQRNPPRDPNTAPPLPRIDVLVRVFDRMADLEVNLGLIRRHWTHHDCRVIVVSNGLAAGHRVPAAARALADEVLELDTNAGHVGGAAQLLRAGLPLLDASAACAVLIEADNWLFSDVLIESYRLRMAREGAVWASAEWVERHHSLAVDFAIADIGFLQAHPQIFDFARSAETHVCNTLRDLGANYLLLTECMPVHVPKSLRKLHDPYGGRLRSFTRAQMVTHHLEDLAGGLIEKMARANVVLGRREFDVPVPGGIGRERRKLRLIEWLARVAPRSRWIKGKNTKRD
jgi:hypothetical protein